jgi:alpha-glucosidase
MGEFSEEPERCGCFEPPDVGLHSGYSFPLLEAHTLGPDFIRRHYAMLDRHPGHWPSVAFSNHDVMRTLTRFGGKDAPPALAQMMLALLFSLKGTALIYQGEELGLPQVDLRRDQLKDPVGDLYYPLHKGRDGCRTPMPWDADQPNLGFSAGTPWLPLGEVHRALAVSRQTAQKESSLNWTKRVLAARKQSRALRLGEIAFLDIPAPALAFVREFEGERVLCAFNMSAEPAKLPDRLFSAAKPLLESDGVTRSAEALVLAPYGVCIAVL